MIIDVISDLHGFKPTLKGGDLLIIAGDWTANDLEQQYFAFFDWVHEQKYQHKVLIAGNHDMQVQHEDYKGPSGVMKDAFIYLCDSGIEVEGIKMWGSPWTKKFLGQNPKAMAFALDTDEEMAEKWAMIPKDTDILITHTPPYGILDITWKNRRCGCNELLKAVKKVNPKYHVFGHLHDSYGQAEADGIKFINTSFVDEQYEPVHQPIRIVYDQRQTRKLGTNSRKNRPHAG